ncbi:MAG: CPBP family intramembrane metalloprotease [Magnetococcales bacterium]|nr:CPBP family intramembrane metalloprotease [Magnetococcales bacterium]
MTAMSRATLLRAWWIFFAGSVLLLSLLFAWRPLWIREALFGLSLLQLVVGLTLARRGGVAPEGLFTGRGWGVALGILALLLLLEQVVVAHAFGPRQGWLQAAIELVRRVVLIGFVEELWFRGVWMALFRERMAISIGLGSLLFGLMHLPGSGEAVVYTTGVGLLFAAARQRGASILTLALAHGALDWINRVVFPGSAFRMGPVASMTLYAAVCLTATVVLLWRDNQSPRLP